MPFISQEVEDVPDRKLSPRHTCTLGDIGKGGSSFLVLPFKVRQVLWPCMFG